MAQISEVKIGHYIFKDFLKTSDANFTILKLLSLVKKAENRY